MLLIFQLDGKQTDLFPTSSTRSNEPCIIRVSDSTFALCRETQTVLVNVKGETERNKALRWSEMPVAIAWDEPYALGVLTDSIEVTILYTIVYGRSDPTDKYYIKLLYISGTNSGT